MASRGCLLWLALLGLAVVVAAEWSADSSGDDSFSEPEMEESDDDWIPSDEEEEDNEEDDDDEPKVIEHAEHETVLEDADGGDKKKKKDEKKKEEEKKKTEDEEKKPQEKEEEKTELLQREATAREVSANALSTLAAALKTAAGGGGGDAREKLATGKVCVPKDVCKSITCAAAERPKPEAVNDEDDDDEAAAAAAAPEKEQKEKTDAPKAFSDCSAETVSTAIPAFKSAATLKHYDITCDFVQCVKQEQCTRYPLVLGLNYIGSGFDIVFEKMRALPLIEWTYSEKKMYNSERFVPDQVNIRPINSHDESSTAKAYSSATEYCKETSAAVSAGGGFGGFSASVSVSGASMSAQTKSLSGSLASLIIKRHLYSMKLLPTRFRIRKEALDVLLKQGPKEFISTYGTHYLEAAKLGGMKRYLATMSESQSSKASAREIAVAVKAKFGSFGSMSASFGMRTSRKSKKANSVRNVKLWCNGGDNCKGDGEAWTSSLRQHPGLVEYELSPIYKLLPEGSARDAVKKYYDAYIDDARRLKKFFGDILPEWHQVMKAIVLEGQKNAESRAQCIKQRVHDGIKTFCKLWRCGSGAPTAASLEPNRRDLELQRLKKKTSTEGRKHRSAPLRFVETIVLKNKDKDKTIAVINGKLVAKPTKEVEGKRETLFYLEKRHPITKTVRRPYGRRRRKIRNHDKPSRHAHNYGKGETVMNGNYVRLMHVTKKGATPVRAVFAECLGNAVVSNSTTDGYDLIRLHLPKQQAKLDKNSIYFDKQSDKQVGLGLYQANKCRDYSDGFLSFQKKDTAVQFTKYNKRDAGTFFVVIERGFQF